MLLLKIRNIITFILACVIVLLRTVLRGYFNLLVLSFLAVVYVPLKVLKWIIDVQGYWLLKLVSMHTFIYNKCLVIYRGALK